MSILSPKHALDDEELHFLTKIAGGLPVATSFRRIWPEQCVDRAGEKLPAKDVHRKADRKFHEPHMQAFMEELQKSPKDIATTTVQEQMLLGDPVSARSSAKMVLENEDVLGALSDNERFWVIAAACGAEVEANVGGQVVRVPLTELMPKFKDATPPQDALDKTARSLEEWYEKLSEWEEELEGRERAAR